MVELQHKFNEQTIPNYLDENLNWNSAIIAKKLGRTTMSVGKIARKIKNGIIK